MSKMAAKPAHEIPSAGSESKRKTMNITVLAGGPGAERDVSIQSGRAVAEALSRRGHRVTISDISPDDLSALEHPADFVFIALHGQFGEDGTLQAELDRRGLPYVGCGAQASRIAMDKVLAKRAFEEAGVPTPKYVVIEQENDLAALSDFPVPAVVKPAASGSSVDTSIARDREALQTKARHLFRQDGRALIEAYIVGPELTVGILGGMALPVCEIRTRREFYDYHAKYVDENTQYLFDLELSPDLVERVQVVALQAFRALGCEVFSRVDVMIDRETQRPYVLEINTIPGFTSHSLVPKAAARVGIEFDELCERLVEMSLRCRRG
ncbi:MAG: D-alanine--D-alanine ligase [Phycisphaerae bacterium]|nr:D-alanine--D-alanine ligase [Phycisphaerae bacterium]